MSLNNNWIPISSGLRPYNEEVVEITAIDDFGEYFTINAFYENGTVNVKDSIYWWHGYYYNDYDGWGNPCDSWKFTKCTDIVPEGWWYHNRLRDSFFKIHFKVVAWHFLSDPYKEE